MKLVFKKIFLKKATKHKNILKLSKTVNNWKIDCKVIEMLKYYDHYFLNK
jgi:hypothetical protein